MSEVTEIIRASGRTETDTADQLLPLVYKSLRQLAKARLAEQPSGQTLQPTMLVHEAYLRLVDVKHPHAWNGRSHFFGAAAEAMRRIIIENASRKSTTKRGGHLRRVELIEPWLETDQPAEEVLALNDALSHLEKKWPKQASLVKLKYFAKMTIPEAADALEISTATAERYWRFARAWLHSQLYDDQHHR